MILGYFFAADYNKVVELSFDIRTMDERTLCLILYSRSKLNQDVTNSNEYKLLNTQFKNIEWEQSVDRFHIQDENIKKNLLDFIRTI